MQLRQVVKCSSAQVLYLQCMDITHVNIQHRIAFASYEVAHYYQQLLLESAEGLYMAQMLVGTCDNL